MSSACIATPVTSLNFRINADASDRVQLRLSKTDDRHNGNMSSTFRPADLPGLNLAALTFGLAGHGSEDRRIGRSKNR